MKVKSEKHFTTKGAKDTKVKRNEDLFFMFCKRCRTGGFDSNFVVKPDPRGLYD